MPSAHSNAIDIGCGTGGLTLQLRARQVYAIGVDRSLAMLAYAKANAAKLGMRDIFQQADATTLPFKAETYELALAASLINVVQDPVAVLKEMRRVVRTNGAVSVLVPANAMTPTRVRHYCKAHGIKRLDAALFELWAKHAPKMEQTEAIALARAAGLEDLASRDYIGGMAFAITGIKRSSQ